MRTRNLDSRTGPVENLLPNPSMERIQAGTSVVRRNLFPNPIPTTYVSTIGGARISLSNGDGFVRAAVTDTLQVSNAQRIGPLPSNGTLGAPAVPGRVYTMSAEVRTERLHEFRFNSLSWDGSNMSSMAAGASTFANTKAGEWTRVWKTVTAGVGVQRVGFEVGLSDVNARVMGETFDIRNILIEERPALLPFFHGGTANTNGVAYSWDGGANASISSARAFLQETRRNFCLNPSAASASLANVIFGGNSGGTVARSTTEGRTDSTSFAYTAGSTAGSDKGPQIYMVGLTAGKTYTTSAWVKASGLFTPNGLRVGVYWGSWLGVSAYTTVVGAWVRVSITFTVPASGGNGSMVVGAPQVGGQTGADLLIDDILVEESGVLLEYFDGSNTPDADMTPSWTGAVDASPSILSCALVNRLGGMNIVRAASFQYPGELRVINLNTASDSCARIDLLPYVREGYTYTILAKLKIRQLHSAAIAPIQGTQRRSLFLDISGGGGNTRGFGATNPSPNVVGEYIHRVTFTVPAVNGSPVTGLGARLYNGGALGDASMYWDEAMLVPGDYTGPYIDGDRRGCSWRDLAHDSGSVGYPLAA